MINININNSKPNEESINININLSAPDNLDSNKHKQNHVMQVINTYNKPHEYKREISDKSKKIFENSRE